ncbi:hypothetical protein P691DRAFT_778706 [Macrolepiota fuliginosa MF-IS2]|uniref:Uncharacterized protein n=1 Tax=Macrolepiota fuliginosa MF-IS2 TaxID=1400762 RepID=A0A9P6BZT3_9AGAR|nr:hypothetical protein P691DRAFT_778706 [Macrolepiota fuliginosa MF-IS2]
MALPIGKCIIQTVVPTAPPGEGDVGCLKVEDDIKVGARRVYHGGEDINKIWELEPVNSTGFNVFKMFNSGGSAKDNEDLLFVYYIGPQDAQGWTLKPQPHAGDDIFEIEVQSDDGILKKWAVSSDNKQVRVLPVLLIEDKGFSTLFRIIPLLK